MDNMKSTITERGDYWHPDPEKDKKLGGPGANQRAREDRADAAKPKSDPKKLRKGESYMDYAKRHGYKKSTPKKKSLLGRLGLRKEAYRVLAKDKGEEGKPSQFSYKDEKDAKKFADGINKKGGKATVTKEHHQKDKDGKVIEHGDGTPSSVEEGLKGYSIGGEVKKGIKRHKDAVEKKKIENRKAVPYAALAAEYKPEGQVIEGKGYQPEIEHSKLGDAKKKADKKRESKLPPHLQGDALGKMKKAFATEEDKKGKGSGTKDACYHKVKASAKVWPSAYASGRLVQCRKKGASNYGSSKKEEVEYAIEEKKKKKNCGCGKDPCITYGKQEEMKEAKSAAWQRKEGKRESGGLNQKGVDSYRAANPGSKLKTAVTTKPSKLKKGSKSANRRKSFCARMGGMKKKLTSAKTANDPDSRINKSLRKWNCSYEPDGTPIMEEDKAFKYVLAKLKAKHGDGVLTKRDKIKPQSAADKAKARAHQAKVDKENAAERAKDPSQGRYPKG